MPFDLKAWENSPSDDTPISAAALTDMEMRLSNYTDVEDAELSTRVDIFEDIGLRLGQRLEHDVSDALLNSLTEHALVLRQTRNGAIQGDPIFAIEDASQADPSNVTFYLLDTGGLYTMRDIVCSAKRFNTVGAGVATGAHIQGISSVADGSEQGMISASVDVNGPAIRGEAYVTQDEGFENRSAFAAYDESDISGGSTPYSPGYGRKKWVLQGDGTHIWGADLQMDPWVNGEIFLGRNASDGYLDLRMLYGETILRLRTESTRGSAIRLGSSTVQDLFEIRTNATDNYAEMRIDGREVIRFYSKPVGSDSGACIAVGGVDDPSAIGTFDVGNAHVITKGLVARGKASQVGNLFEVQDSSQNALGGFDNNGYLFLKKTAAPADADLDNGELAIWFDKTNGAAKLMIKAKENGGTVRTATVALA